MRVVVKGGDERVRLQHLLDACALHADAASVHDAHLAQAYGMRMLEIRLDDVGNVTRRERMEIELRPDGDDVGIIHSRETFNA